MNSHIATIGPDHPAQHQKGAVLVVSLLILLVMTVLGIAAMGTTTLQERMAYNNRQQQVAFQSAEAALRSAENWLAANVTDLASLAINFNNTTPVSGNYSERAPMTGVATRPLTGFNIYDDSVWLTTGNAVVVTAGTTVTQQPRYIIEYMGRVGPPPKDYDPKKPDVRQYGFRITAIGWGEGTTPNTRYLVQSSYRIPL